MRLHFACCPRCSAVFVLFYPKKRPKGAWLHMIDRWHTCFWLTCDSAHFAHTLCSDWSLCSHCMQQILESVNYCHQMGIVHRDLKVRSWKGHRWRSLKVTMQNDLKTERKYLKPVIETRIFMLRLCIIDNPFLIWSSMF